MSTTSPAQPQLTVHPAPPCPVQWIRYFPPSNALFCVLIFSASNLTLLRPGRRPARTSSIRHLDNSGKKAEQRERISCVWWGLVYRYVRGGSFMWSGGLFDLGKYTMSTKVFHPVILNKKSMRYSPMHLVSLSTFNRLTLAWCQSARVGKCHRVIHNPVRGDRERLSEVLI